MADWRKRDEYQSNPYLFHIRRPGDPGGVRLVDAGCRGGVAVTKRIILEGRRIHKAIPIGDEDQFPPEYIVPDMEDLRFGPLRNFLDPHEFKFNKSTFYPRLTRRYDNGDIDVIYLEGKP